MRVFFGSDDTWFNSYHSFSDHISFLSQLHSAYPANTELFSSGTSLEGRDLAGIHIFGSGGAGSKPAVIYHSTVHAREWITTMVSSINASSLLYDNGLLLHR
jgi:carboxypeptidase A4